MTKESQTTSSLEQELDSITPDERQRRQKAVDYARASVGLEGFKPTPAAEALAARFISGEISMADFVEQMPVIDPELITPAERRRREEGERVARASVGLEGFTPTKTAEALSRRFIAGEITIEQAVQLVIADHR